MTSKKRKSCLLISIVVSYFKYLNCSFNFTLVSRLVYLLSSFGLSLCQKQKWSNHQAVVTTRFLCSSVQFKDDTSVTRFSYVFDPVHDFISKRQHSDVSRLSRRTNGIFLNTLYCKLIPVLLFCQQRQGPTLSSRLCSVGVVCGAGTAPHTVHMGV